MADEQKPEGAAPPPPPPEAEPPNRGVMIVVSYLWPLAFGPLLLEKQDPEAQWHAKQGLLLFVAEFFAFVALGILAESRMITAVCCWSCQ